MNIPAGNPLHESNLGSSTNDCNYTGVMSRRVKSSSLRKNTGKESLFEILNIGKVMYDRSLQYGVKGAAKYNMSRRLSRLKSAQTKTG